MQITKSLALKTVLVLVSISLLSNLTKISSQEPQQISPEENPSQTSETPKEATLEPKLETEIGKPKIEEQKFEEDNNQGYRLERVETRKFQQPDGKIKTITKSTSKTVSYGFIETNTELDTDIDGILSKQFETKTETQDGTAIANENTNSWGVITKNKQESKQVSNELKETLALNPVQYKAEPEIKPEINSENTETAPKTYPSGMKCSDFSTFEEAQAALPTNPQLDKDSNGEACESLASNGNSSGGGTYQRTKSRRKK